MIVLDLPMEENDAKAATIRDYLKALLAELWRKEEGFNGKRPFGNSGWTWDVYRALVKGNAIKGKFSSDGDLIEHDQEAGDRMIQEAINALR
jgi:hypothetical protein